jgi:hypothetical protein
MDVRVAFFAVLFEWWNVFSSDEENDFVKLICAGRF